MSRALADTSVFIAQETGRWINEKALPEDLAVSVVTIGELTLGVLAATTPELQGQRLSTLASALALGPLPVDHGVAESWARLRALLRSTGQRMPANDSWIAATAMSLGVPVVTQDADYDVSVADLQVIRV